ncbi:MAG: hypothetical protein DYG89_44870 [Caldilinea sp. CFX5]|nr:hypothetical protein [Caldilinea sp. CFX5]
MIIALFVLSWAVLSCKSAPAFEDVYHVVAAATLKPGVAIPPPQQELLLTVTGKIKNVNHEDAIQMDRTTIEAVGLVEYTVTDPFEQRPIRYRGVLMRDLLNLWQVADDATIAQLTALNDYKIDIPLDEFRQYPILFALQADGVYMEPDYRGPAMIVYPVDQYQFEPLAVQRKWIWQIKAINIQ